jgi:hypothetical protein
MGAVWHGGRAVVGEVLGFRPAAGCRSGVLSPRRTTDGQELWCLLASSAGAFAYEPPHTQANAALRSGRVAFVGKVLALTLDDPKVLELSYVVEREDEGGPGIDFLLGQEYLLEWTSCID